MTTSAIVLLVGVALAESPAADGPEATVKNYFAALAKEDSAAANRLTARFPKFGEAEVAAVTDRFIQGMKRRGKTPELRGGKSIDDCAVVLMYESPTDPDPAYLIRQDDTWRVLPRLTDFHRDFFELPDDVQRRFRELEDWYKSQVGKSTRPKK